MWHGEAASACAGDDYRYAIDSTWNDCFDTEGAVLYRRDPYARYCPVSEGAFCRIDDPGAFKWAEPEHTNLLNDGLASHSIYEMHVGTFSPEGTFRGALERLEHVASLGFTCIELMPITDFGGAWGYNPRSCLAVHTPYGTPDDLRAFVDKAHSLGMAVMVDICLNHGYVCVCVCVCVCVYAHTLLHTHTHTHTQIFAAQLSVELGRFWPRQLRRHLL